MNENNYKDLDSTKFIEILEGQDSNYFLPSTANQQYSQRMTEQAYRNSGLGTVYKIRVASMDDRRKDQLEYRYKTSIPSSFWPDFNDPIVIRINGNIFWNRGMNLYTGEGPKPELTLPIDLMHCEFHQRFSIKDVKSNQDLVLHQCTFLQHRRNNLKEEGEFIIRSSQFKNIEIEHIESKLDGKTVPLRKINLQDVTAEQVRISLVQVDEILINSQEGTIKKLVIEGSSISKLIIRGNHFEEIELSMIKSNGQIIIDAQISKLTLVGNPLALFEESAPRNFIGSVSLTLYNQVTKGKFYFRDADINHLYIYGVNNNSLLLKDCQINKIFLEAFTNTGELSFHNIEKISTLSIVDSSLGKAEFLSVDLFKPYQVKVLSSNLLDIVLINTVFPGALEAKNKSDYTGIREAFRQLKLASAKQGNRIQELNYEALEMDAYTKESTAIKTKWDRIILFTNKWSNNHGRDPGRALLGLVASTTFCYSLIKLCQGSIFNLEYTANTLAEYLNFALNPLHDYDRLFNLTKSNLPQLIWDGIARLLDTLSRLVSGYLIFQFLRAFRKFVK